MSNSLTRQEIEGQIIARAWQDESFKQELLRDPLATFAKEGINLPDGLEVKVVEESSNLFYLVLPTKPSNTEELSSEELEAIAGGAVNVWKCGKTALS